MEENNSLFEFEVDQPTSIETAEMARWAKMFGILVLIMIGIGVLAVAAGWGQIQNQFAAYPEADTSATMTIVLVAGILVCAVVAIMMFFLVRGASRVKSGVLAKDQQAFNSGLGDIKVFFIFYGIIALIGLMGNLTSLFK